MARKKNEAPVVEETPVDEESAKLLEELAQQDTASTETPVVEETPVDEETPVVEDAQAEVSRTITNTGKNPRRIGGTTVPVGGTYDLTDQDIDDKLLMQKIQHSIDMGVLSHGAD